MDYPWEGMPLCEHRIQFDCDRCKKENSVLGKIIYSANEVFNELGSGHTEAVYEAALSFELMLNGFATVARQVPCALVYKGFNVGVGYIDIWVHNVIVELKSVAKLTPKDVQQVRKYLQAIDLDYGLLINFGNSLEIVEVQRETSGILTVPFPLSSEDAVVLKETWEKGEYEQTPSSED